MMGRTRGDSGYGRWWLAVVVSELSATLKTRDESRQVQMSNNPVAYNMFNPFLLESAC